MTFPLPIRWTVQLDGWATRGPVVNRDVVAVRTRKSLYAIDVGSGAVRSQVEVDPKGSGGWFIAAAGDTIVVDREVDRTTRAIGVIDGRVAWQVDTRAIIVPQGVTAIGTRLYMLGRDEGGATVLRGLESGDGSGFIDVRLPWPADQLLAAGGQLLAAHSGGSPGLFGLGPDGRDAQVVIDDPVARIDAGSVLLAVARPSDSGPRLEIRDLATLQPLWSAGVRCSAAAVDGDEVLAIAGETSPLAVLHDARTGAIRWRGAVLAGDPESARLAGPAVGLLGMGVLYLHARRDGAALGSVPMGLLPVSHQDDLIIAKTQTLSCARVP